VSHDVILVKGTSLLLKTLNVIVEKDLFHDSPYFNFGFISFFVCMFYPFAVYVFLVFYLERFGLYLRTIGL